MQVVSRTGRTSSSRSSSCCAHINACCEERKLDSDEQKAPPGELMYLSPVRRCMHSDSVFLDRSRCDSGCVASQQGHRA